jgi:hypothetical protein
MDKPKRTPPPPTTPSEGSVPGEGTSEPLAVGRELCDRLRRMNDANEQDGDIPLVSAACPRCGLTFSERVDRSSFTPEELKAVEWFAAGDETAFAWGWKFRAETLRGLLTRLE